MSPLGVVAVLGAVLSILAYSRRPSRSTRVNLQFLLSLLSFALLWYATSSPFAAEGMMNLPDHMIGHILTMFMVPIGIVGSSYHPIFVVDPVAGAAPAAASVVVPRAHVARAPVALSPHHGDDRAQCGDGRPRTYRQYFDYVHGANLDDAVVGRAGVSSERAVLLSLHRRLAAATKTRCACAIN